MLFSHEPIKAFLIPDSCKATVENSISVEVTGDTIKKKQNDDCLLCSFQRIWQLFWTFYHCRINTLYVQRLTFLPVSKARTDKCYIFWQCSYILYVHVIQVVEISQNEIYCPKYYVGFFKNPTLQFNLYKINQKDRF